MFEPTAPPADAAQLGAWALSNFTELARLLGNGQPFVLLVPQARAPSRPRAGMVVNADGTNWNPGGGAGLYQYLAAAWVKL